jgi:hypothetical protein
MCTGSIPAATKLYRSVHVITAPFSSPLSAHAHSSNSIGPDGATALASSLTSLSDLKILGLR